MRVIHDGAAMTYVRMDTILFVAARKYNIIYLYIYKSFQGTSEVRKKKSNQIHLFQFWRRRLRFPSVRPHKSVVKSFSRTSFAAMNGRQLNTTAVADDATTFLNGISLSSVRTTSGIQFIHIPFII